MLSTLFARQSKSLFFKRKMYFVSTPPRSLWEHRIIVANTQSPFKCPPGITQKAQLISFGGDDEIHIEINIFRSEKDKGRHPRPTYFYAPGTAFIAHESPHIIKAVCGILTDVTGAQGISISHRLLPDCPTLSPFRDTNYIIHKIMNNPHKFEVDLNNCIGIGYSSGGNLIALAAIQAAAKGLKFKGHILISPIIDLSRKLKGFEQYKKFGLKDQCVDEALYTWIASLNTPSYLNLKSPSVSPLYAMPDNLEGMAPTDIFVGEFDQSRPDAHAYHQKLLGAKVESTLFIARNQDHSYWWKNEEMVRIIAARMKETFLGEKKKYDQNLAWVKTTKKRILDSEEEKEMDGSLLPGHQSALAPSI